MTAEEIGKIIAQGEGISIEFKKAMEKVPASLYETVVSFANTRGGYILDAVRTLNPNNPYFNGIMDLNNFNPHPKNPNIRKFFTALGWADEIGSGIRNTRYYLPYYVEKAAPVFIDEPLFRTIIPLVRNTMSDFADEWFKWLDLDEKWKPLLTESLKNIEIDGRLHNMTWEEQMCCLAPYWIEKTTALKPLKISEKKANRLSQTEKPTKSDEKNRLSSDEKVTKFENFESPINQYDKYNEGITFYEKVTKLVEANRLSQTEKPTKLSNKKMRYLLVILFASAIPVTIDELMELFEYRHKDTFRQNYVKPLESIGFITKTQPEKPTASNQKYVITEQGKRFLTGQSN